MSNKGVLIEQTWKLAKIRKAKESLQFNNNKFLAENTDI